MEHWNKACRHFPVQTSNTNAINKALEMNKFEKLDKSYELHACIIFILIIIFTFHLLNYIAK